MNDPIGMRYGTSEYREPFHYMWCGLDDVYLCSGYEQVPNGDGTFDITVHDQDGLHRAIGEFLVREKKALSGKELRFLRRQMDVTQSELATLLGTTDQAVARWEKEQTRISGVADTLLRVIYLGHIGDHIDVQEVIKQIRAIDSPSNDRQVFRETQEGWKLAA